MCLYAHALEAATPLLSWSAYGPGPNFKVVQKFYQSRDDVAVVSMFVD
jgi:hypothetical protein